MYTQDQMIHETVWRDIEGFEGFGVSNQGQVVSDWTSRPMAICVNQQGISFVRIMKDKRQYNRSLALLVAKAFLDPPRNEAYNSVIHLNGDKQDCRAINLMWRPRWYALQYHDMFNQEPSRVGVYIPATKETFGSLREFCTKYGLVENRTYQDMFNGDKCFHYGWIVEKLEE